MALKLTFLDDSDASNLLPVLQIDSDKKFTSLSIKYLAIDSNKEERIISLNKKSAIKLAKELRKHISFLED
jgi:hypothetical protein